MINSSLQSTVIYYLNRILYQNAYLNIILSTIAASRKFSPDEKYYLSSTLWGVITWYKKLEWIAAYFSSIPLKRYERRILLYILTGIFHLLEENDTLKYTVVDTIVEAVKQEKGEKAAGFVNGILRTVQRNGGGELFPHCTDNPVYDISVRYSFPEWIIARWVSRYGIENTIKLCQWNNQRHLSTIRINSLKKDTKEFIKFLIKYHIMVEAHKNLPNIFYINDTSSLIHSHWFKEGYFIIQSASSAAAAIALAPISGETIIDVCAAPGGKTTHIAELMHDKGTILGIDINKNRIKLLKDNIQRLDITSIDVQVADATAIKLPEADRIIIDAPCSGFGALHQKPDIRWKRTESDIYNLSQLQFSLLKNSARYVKKGGILLYTTCTIEPEENQQVIDKFLAVHKEFDPEPVPELIEISQEFNIGYAVIIPFTHSLDGSFIAKLRKKNLTY